MVTDDLLIQYRVLVDGEQTIEGSIYREWWGVLIVLYGTGNNSVEVLNHGEWFKLYPY